jgi:DNA-directed RNA polymerase specialized sigma24 family protein
MTSTDTLGTYTDAPTQLAADIMLIRRQVRSNPKRMQRVCTALRSEGHSLTKIGSIVNRDHKTVMYHLRRAQDG